MEYKYHQIKPYITQLQLVCDLECYEFVEESVFDLECYEFVEETWGLFLKIYVAYVCQS